MSDSPSQPKSYFISLFCEALSGGLYTFLFCMALYLLLRQRKLRPGKGNVVMLAATVLMYLLSILHLAFSFKLNFVALFEQKAAQAQSKNPESVETTLNIFACTPIAAETLNCLLGDSIVIWRTWVLWNRDWRIIYFPCGLLLGAAVAGAFMVRAMYISLTGPGSLFNVSTTAAVMAFCVLTTTINVYAIVAIGYRAWIHSRTMKIISGGEDLIVGGLGGRYSRIFLVFVESGFIYSIALILMMILFGAYNNGVYIVIGILAQLTGIYPTSIIVLVCLQLTQHDHITRMESTINFQRRGHHILTTDLGATSVSYTPRPVVIPKDKQENLNATGSMV
ncbi:hypothetical protein GYMLUDRAFT_248382 [Collybiopsis luxurians FD-317 M1]|uniref:Uncharacterized protein n=1 Tax=Collybiopsis luxurians FD-317 M1 TaxID=944289 RepID=A0A0D0AYL8_9AGAR|nr:hypothetical protein GYMLUDRAFT_248382 [Collybiopsis luxurians FD-317 M1]